MKEFTDRSYWHNEPAPHRARRKSPPGDPYKYVGRLARLIRRAGKQGVKLRVVLYSRVSSGKQKWKGTLGHQLPALRRKVRRLAKKYGANVTIVGEFAEDVSAWRLWKSSRPELVRAGEVASRKDAIIVALHTSRFVRNRHHARGVAPTVEDFENLQALTSQVPLATIIPPDQQEDRSGDIRRGQKNASRKPGRPKHPRPGEPGYLKWRRQYLLPKVRRDKKNGHSNRQIGIRYGIDERSVREWLSYE